MNRLGIIGIIIAVGVLILLAFNVNPIDRQLFEDTFSVSAIYYPDDKMLEITYFDNSDGTTSVVLEILGMKESFQKTYNVSSFSEKVPLASQPQYGWSSIPVTFLVEHKEFGKIGLKTEISSIGDPQARVIYGKP